MEEKYLITDGYVETVSDFETLSDELQKVASDPYRWKWGIFAMHSGLQGMMVLALQGSNGLRVLKKEDARRWLDAHEKGEQYPADLQLDGFLDLYRKIKGDPMRMYVNSKKFTPEGTQGSSIKRLNRLRNEYVHFTPRVWMLKLAGLPRILLDCLGIAEFLAWQSGNILWTEEDLQKRTQDAFATSRSVLSHLMKDHESS